MSEVKLTGKEWFNKFYEETKKDGTRIFTPEEQKIADEHGKEFVAIRMMYQAAKRASGIKDAYYNKIVWDRYKA